MKAVGRNVPRLEGWDKVSGKSQYIDDLSFPNMLFGRTIRSGIAHGKLAAIDLSQLSPEFVIVDHTDIPGCNIHKLIDDDQPMLAEEQIRHKEEPILLLAHASRRALFEAEVPIRYEEQSANYDAHESEHVFKEIEIKKGDLNRGFEEADRIVTGEYHTGHQEQLYIEPNGVIAVPEASGGVTIFGSLQCPYYVHQALTVLLGLPDDQVRIVQAETGGGFGGKEEYPSMIAGHAALLALKANRPVKLIYDRTEDMRATTKRHPSWVRHRTGVKRDGTITAMEIDVLMDGGAYSTLSAVVLSRGVLHASGPYRCAHISIRGRAVHTNTPPNGAFRGFGAPQTQFAMEVHMDRIAEELGMDNVDLRTQNALRPGDTTATGQVLGPDTSALEVLKEAVRRTDFKKRRADLRDSNRALGLALFFHGSGFTGSGEVRLDSEAALQVTSTGVRILVASTEIGQGTRTMHAQIVADALEIPYEQVEVSVADTGLVPNSGPTVASRTCMIVGGILQACALELKNRLQGRSLAEYFAEKGAVVIQRKYQKPAEIEWDEENYRGTAYGTYAWACDVVELELDPDTYCVTPIKLTAVQDIGKAIHPILARGQIEGGSLQGLGHALLEEVVMRSGCMANASLTNYIIPTTLDTPEMDTVIWENPYVHGPFGAKGVGELPMDGPAPAVVNALRSLGLDVKAVPATPERIMEAACAVS